MSHKHVKKTVELTDDRCGTNDVNVAECRLADDAMMIAAALIGGNVAAAIVRPHLPLFFQMWRHELG